MQNVHRDFSAHSAMSPVLQEGLVTDVAAAVRQSAQFSTAILSVDVTVCPRPLNMFQRLPLSPLIYILIS